VNCYVLDTNAMADLMAKVSHTYTRFRACLSEGDRFLLRPVVLYEVERGLRAQPEATTKRRSFDFLRGEVEYLEFHQAVWLEAASLWASARREGRPRADDDLLSAAFARIHGAAVVTRNTQDFEGLGVPLENWSQPP